jgi:hypothetical protein
LLNIENRKRILVIWKLKLSCFKNNRKCPICRWYIFIFSTNLEYYMYVFRLYFWIHSVHFVLLYLIYNKLLSVRSRFFNIFFHKNTWKTWSFFKMMMFFSYDTISPLNDELPLNEHKFFNFFLLIDKYVVSNIIITFLSLCPSDTFLGLQQNKKILILKWNDHSNESLITNKYKNNQ